MDDWDDPIETPTEGTSSSSDTGSTADEEAVRRYLTWIEDPSSLRDEGHIADLQAKIDGASDPIEKIHLASDLHRARQVDGTALRHAFVVGARRWADANGIVPEAFAELGVPSEDLRRAGFDLPGPAGRRQSPTGTVGPSTRPATRVTADDIRAAARAFEEPFTIADLRDRVGGSPGTVRKALESMVADGQLENLGSAEGWPGPGRPPNRYRVRR